MKRKAYIVEPNGQNHLCPQCFRDVFYLTRGCRKKYLNTNKTVWQEKSHYIKTCVTCGNKEFDTVYDRITYTNEQDYNKYENSLIG